MKSTLYLAIALLLGQLTWGQSGFLARPTKLFFNPAPASQQKQTVTLRNTSQEPVLLECSLQDWTRDSLGNKVYSNAGTLSTSCSKYLKLFPEVVSLQPGEEKDVEVTLSAPQQQLPSTLNTMMMVTQVNEKKAEQSKVVQTQIVVRMQIGIHVYFEPPYLEQKDVELSRLFFAKSGTASKEDLLAHERGLVCEIANIGKLVAEGKVRLELNHENSKQEWKLEDKEFNSLPGDKLQIPFTLPANLPKGTYNILALLDMGAEHPLKVIEAQIEM